MVSFLCTHWRLHTVIFCRYSVSVEVHFSILMMIRGAFYVIFEHKNKYSIWKSFPLRKHIFSTSRFTRIVHKMSNTFDECKWRLSGKESCTSSRDRANFSSNAIWKFSFYSHSHSGQNCMTTAMWKILQSCPIVPHPLHSPSLCVHLLRLSADCYCEWTFIERFI